MSNFFPVRPPLSLSLSLSLFLRFPTKFGADRTAPSFESRALVLERHQRQGPPRHLPVGVYGPGHIPGGPVAGLGPVERDEQRATEPWAQDSEPAVHSEARSGQCGRRVHVAAAVGLLRRGQRKGLL